MTAIDTVTDIPRDRWGRPMVTPPGGGKPVAYTRCTTYVSALEDTFQLSRWQQRMVALGLADRPDLALAVTAHREDKGKLNELCQDAIEAAKGRAAATTGTALHALTELIDRDRELPVVPDTAKADLEAYRQATAAYVPLGIEQFCVLDDLRIGGTPDRIMQCPDGVNRIADIKTGNIEWGVHKIAMQLAAYSRSVAYDHATGRRIPLPDVDPSNGIVIHLPAGQASCSLYWIDLKRGWEAVQLATRVRQWRAEKGLIVPIQMS